MRPSSLNELWKLASEMAPTTRGGTDPAHTFDCSAVGLILRADEGRCGSDFTPLNSDTFAETGGDGVHFGFLLIPGRETEDAPLVMTVPMTLEPDRANIIVGANLPEFLALGTRYGYFALEQLAYDRDATIAAIEQGRDDFDEEDRRLLGAIIERFKLRPWSNVRARLDELERMFRDKIQLGDWV